MKFRLYLASVVVLCLVSILVFLGTEDAQRSLRLSEEIHTRTVPALRHLEQMRFGILRIVSSTSELMVAHFAGGGQDEQRPRTGEAVTTETKLIEQGSDSYRMARQELLALYLNNDNPAPDHADLQAIDRSHAELAATSERIISLVHARASPQELTEAKEVFEVQEMQALGAIAQALGKTQQAADAQYSQLTLEITELRNQTLGLGVLAVAVLLIYSVFVIRLLQREAKARQEAEDLAAANAAEIERRRHIEDRLAAHQKMEALGTMVGGIAHSVNNLLVPIITLSKMLKQDAPAGSEQQLDLARILASGEKASRLLKDMLAFSRTGAAAPSGGCELADCLRRTLSLARAALPASVELHERILVDAAWVPVEESEIDTIVFNLLSNAADAIDSGSGRIDVSLARVMVEKGSAKKVPVRLQAGEYACLTIADNGCGIAETVLPHVFEPFFTTKPVGKGTGLGLSVIYGSVTQAGGDIIVDSKLGAGTRFDLFLPLLERGTAGATTNTIENRSKELGQATLGG
jgi:signal transduction histidine kinase